MVTDWPLSEEPLLQEAARMTPAKNSSTKSFFMALKNFVIINNIIKRSGQKLFCLLICHGAGQMDGNQIRKLQISGRITEENESLPGDRLFVFIITK
jgi:hypothetical protein